MVCSQKAAVCILHLFGRVILEVTAKSLVKQWSINIVKVQNDVNDLERKNGRAKRGTADEKVISFGLQLRVDQLERQAHLHSSLKATSRKRKQDLPQCHSSQSSKCL